MRPKILVFASGSATGGGSGLEKLVEATRNGTLQADIVGAVSNYDSGGVRKKATALKIPFFYFPKPWTAERYQEVAQKSGADFFALSGWLKLVRGLDSQTKFNSKRVFNIHPGPLPNFGGSGLYGHHVHETVLSAFKRGEIKNSAVTMHFVTEEYDRGPAFLKLPVSIRKSDTPDTLARRVNIFEHLYQPTITNLVVYDFISWDGINPKSLFITSDYSHLTRYLRVRTTKRKYGENIVVDTADHVCEKFGFLHGDLLVRKDKKDEENERIVIGVAPGNEGQDVLWYTFNHPKSGGEVCYSDSLENFCLAET